MTKGNKITEAFAENEAQKQRHSIPGDTPTPDDPKVPQKLERNPNIAGLLKFAMAGQAGAKRAEGQSWLAGRLAEQTQDEDLALRILGAYARNCVPTLPDTAAVIVWSRAKAHVTFDPTPRGVNPKAYRDSKKREKEQAVDPDAAQSMLPDFLQMEGGAPSDVPDLEDAGKLWGSLYGDVWGYEQTMGAWYQWTGTHWESQPLKSPALDDQATRILRMLELKVSSMSRVDGCIRMAAKACVRAFPATPDLVNFRNGTLDTTTMHLRTHTRNDHLTYCLPYNYAPGDWPTIDQFLKQTIPDPLARQSYMAHVGLALTSDTRLQRAVVMLGPTRSGKSTLIQIANTSCGHEPEASAGPDLFDRAAEGLRSRASWNGRRLVTIEELPVEALRNEEIIKAMIAHGGVAQRRLNTPEVLNNRWIPKLLMATNEAPRYSDRSGALTERLIIVPCPNHRPEDQRDPLLFEKLATEIAAFAVACIEVARPVRQIGRYPESTHMRAVLTTIEESGDAVKAFVSEECILDPKAWTPTDTLFSAYREHSTKEGVQERYQMAKSRFTAALRERYRSLEDGRQYVNGVRTRGVWGIRLRSPHDLYPEDNDA